MRASYSIEPIYLFYDDRLRRMPLDRQATGFRGMVFVQSDPDQLMDKLDMGDIEQYRRRFTSTDDASRSGLMLESFTAGDTITLNLMCAVETDAYYQARLSELKEAGVEHHPSAPPIPYVLMGRTF